MTAVASFLAVLAAVVPLGRSLDGRLIEALRAGDPHGPRVLVVGCIHGNECAGMAVVRALERSRAHVDLWLVPTLNPDGLARGIRGNARGVDLNRRWPSSTEREIRIGRKLIRRLRPRVTIWFHQHMDLVWAFGGSTRAGRRYARAAGMRLYRHRWVAGSASGWQNRTLPGTAAFTVELPAGPLSTAAVRRQVRAVLAVATRAS